MTTSPSIKELLEALATAQGQFAPFQKNSTNESFSSSYADLPAVISATQKALAANGLSVTQMPGWDKDGGTYVETLLGHKSGEWIASKLYLYADPRDPHGMGSAISYARRYALQAVLGVAAEDDDGNGAAKRTSQAKQARTEKQEPKEAKVEKPPEHEWKSVSATLAREDKVKDGDNEIVWHWFTFSNNLAAFTKDNEIAQQVKSLGESPADVRVALIRGKHKIVSVQYIHK